MGQAWKAVVVSLCLATAGCGGSDEPDESTDQETFESVESLAAALGEECSGNLDITPAGSGFVSEQGMCMFEGSSVQLSIYEDTAAMNEILANREDLQAEFDRTRDDDPTADIGALYLVYGDVWSVNFGDEPEVADAVQDATGGQVHVVD